MFKKLLAILEADARDVGLAALAAFVGALVLSPGTPVEDVLVAAGYAAVRAGVGRLAILLGAKVA